MAYVVEIFLRESVWQGYHTCLMQPILCPCARMNPGTDITIREDPFDFASFMANYTLWPDNKFVSWCFKIDRGYQSTKHIRNDTMTLEKIINHQISPFRLFFKKYVYCW